GLLRDHIVDRLERVLAGLADLSAYVLRLGDVEVVARPRVPHAELVEAANTVAHPFPRDEDRAADVETEGVVLKGGPVPIAHQEADQALVRFVHLFLTSREGDARTIDDREVAGHRAVEPDEAVVENV